MFPNPGGSPDNPQNSLFVTLKEDLVGWCRGLTCGNYQNPEPRERTNEIPPICCKWTVDGLVLLINQWQAGKVPLQDVIKAINEWASCAGAQGASSGSVNQQKQQLMAMITPSGQGPSVPPQASSSVILYENSNFGGRSKSFNGDTPYVGDDFNDITSSLKVPQGYAVILYENSNFGGRSKSFNGDTPYVGDNFNDITSSFKVVPAR